MVVETLSMPRRGDLDLSRRTVDALSVKKKDAVFWDRDLPGFGVRVYPSGRKVYVAQSRGPAGLRRVSLGPHGELTPERARKRALAALERIRSGESPAPSPSGRGPRTVADLARRYLDAHVAVHCNPHTRGIYRGTLENHILPALGAKRIEAVGPVEVGTLHYELRATPRAANRALMVLSKMFSLAEAWGLLAPGANPCRFVLRYKEGRRERFLAPEEYRRVGRELRALAGEGPGPERAAAALRLLILTGCRLGEVLTLKWDDVDRAAGELRLRDAKTGARMVPLSPRAAAVLAELAAVPHSPWVFAGRTPDRHLSQLTTYWHRVRRRAGVEDVRIHDLRHSFASRALALGESLAMIGRLLGHSDIGSTARYAHLARDAERVAAARVGESIAADILPADGAARAGAPPATAAAP